MPEIQAKRHFSDAHGQPICQQSGLENDEFIQIPDDRLEASKIVQGPGFCGVCYCIWLSLVAEQARSKAKKSKK